jgi:hypothetical protein
MLQRIRMIDTSFANLTGEFGGVEFVDGLSTREVTTIEAMRIAGCVRAELVDGTNPSIAQIIIDSKNAAMSTDMVREVTPEGNLVVPVPAKIWTEKELEEIADEKGIAGLREIGDTLDVRSNSIPKLISAIIARQRGQEIPAGNTESS